MTRHDIVTIAIRLGALWLVYLAIVSATAMLATWSLAAPDLAIMVLLQVGFLLLMSVVAWKFSSTFASKLLPEIVPGAPLVSWSRADVQDMLFRVLGVFLLAIAASDLVKAWVSSGAGNLAATIATAQRRADLAKHATLALFGLGLIMGRTGLHRAWEKLKNLSGDMPGPDDGEEEEPEEAEQPETHVS